MGAKTPAQLARKADNIAKAGWRNDRLREKQRLANVFRKLGYSGRTEDDIIAKGEAGEDHKARVLLVSRYTGHKVFGKLITKWLGQRINAEPSHVLWLIRKFLDRPRNATINTSLFLEFNPPQKIAA